MSDQLGNVFKKHPAWIIGGGIAAALVLYLATRGSSASAATTDPALALILRLRQRTGGIRRRRAFVFAMPARATEGGAVDVIASAIELHRIASGVESPQREDNGVDDAERRDRDGQWFGYL